MKKSIIAITFFLLIAVAGGAQDTSDGTGKWLQDCSKQAYKLIIISGTADWSFATKDANESYTEGLFEGVVYAAILEATRQQVLKIPRDASGPQIYIVVGNYLDTHPDELNQPADILAVKALKTKWPYK